MLLAWLQSDCERFSEMEDIYTPSPQALEIERRARALIADADRLNVRLRIDTVVAEPFAIGNTFTRVEAWDVLVRHRSAVPVNLSEVTDALDSQERLCKTS